MFSNMLDFLIQLSPQVKLQFNLTPSAIFRFNLAHGGLIALARFEIVLLHGLCLLLRCTCSVTAFSLALEPPDLRFEVGL